MKFGSCLLLILQDVVFEAGVEISAHILAIVPAAVVGLLCGVLGIGFTLLNLKIARFRDATLARYKWRRCIEPCVLVVVYVTGTMLLPRMFPCTPTRCVTYQNQVRQRMLFCKASAACQTEGLRGIYV
jgi:H+/Cl- antiporter ClcA